MFVYNYFAEDHRLYVSIPLEITFDRTFLDDIVGLFDAVVTRKDCTQVLISCKDEKAPNYDKLVLAYLYCSIGHLAKSVKDVKILWHKNLSQRVISTVHPTHGKFVSTEKIEDLIKSPNLNIYYFDSDKDVEMALHEISNFMVSYNLSANPDVLKEYFTTVIGEIVSNSYNHSAQERVFLMYDVLYEENSFTLCVNIIDYGKTIIENVHDYFLRKRVSKNIDPKEALSWAIQKGNTTREGSEGYGLPTLIEYLQKVNGELCIFSGNAYYMLKSDGFQITDMSRGYLSGTNVTFKIKLFNFDKMVFLDPTGESIEAISLDQL